MERLKQRLAVAEQAIASFAEALQQPAGSPKAAIRACRETGLFTEEEAIGALEMVDDRNLTAHTYNERLAQQIYDHLPRYLALVQTWVGQVEGRLR